MATTGLPQERSKAGLEGRLQRALSLEQKNYLGVTFRTTRTRRRHFTDIQPGMHMAGCGYYRGY
jgi:hypothetical protein